MTSPETDVGEKDVCEDGDSKEAPNSRRPATQPGSGRQTGGWPARGL